MRASRCARLRSALRLTLCWRMARQHRQIAALRAGNARRAAALAQHARTTRMGASARRLLKTRRALRSAQHENS
jgi:hypothetical protein